MSISAVLFLFPHKNDRDGTLTIIQMKYVRDFFSETKMGKNLKMRFL